MPDTDMNVVVDLRGVGRMFGQITALFDVNLSVRAGEIVAIVGDNGAGKSTLMNIICGADLPDEGEVYVEGQILNSLRQSQKLGLGMVYQDLALAPDLTVAENMFLGREHVSKGPGRILRWVDRKRMRIEARKAISDLGITTLRNINSPVSRLSGGQRQIVAVARAMMWTKSVLLLDEPTAALGPKQVGMVIDTIRAAAKHGLAVIIVSHDIPHVLTLADRIIVLRRGTVVKDLLPDGLTVAKVVQEMIGELASSQASRDDNND